MKFEKGDYYHVYNRSINREILYRSDENYRYFMERFNHYLDGKVDVISYCLMPTHFHFFVRAVEESLVIEKAFKDLFIAYAKGYNAMYERNGSVFQAKYKKDEIADDSHFTNVIAYIHLNPVKAGLCHRPEDWKYSSYNALLGNSKTKVRRQEVIEWFGSRKSFVEFHEGYRGDTWVDGHLPE